MTLSIMATLLLRLVVCAASAAVSRPTAAAEGGCIMFARETSHYALTLLTEH